MTVPTTTGDRSDDAEQERRLYGTTRPYKVQRRFDGLGMGAEYMREYGLGLFRLGVLWRFMRYVSTPSYPQTDAKLTTAVCIPVSTPRSPKVSQSSSLRARSRHYTHSLCGSHTTSYDAPSLCVNWTCPARTDQDVAALQTRSAPSTRPSHTTDAWCVSR